MALIDKVTVERWVAVVIAAREKVNGDLAEALAAMASAPGWPGRVAWILYTNPDKLRMAISWLRAGVRPSRESLEEARRAFSSVAATARG